MEHVQSQGVIYEHHNCGHFRPVIDDMLEIGIGATNPVHVSNDIAWLKENYGDRMTFLGGLDIQLYGRPTVTEQEIHDDIRKAFSILAPGGGFVPMCAVAYSDHNAFINKELVDAARDYYGPRPDIGQEQDQLNAGIAVVKR